MPKPKITPEKIAEDIRIELRSILRQKQELSRPINCFKLINSVPEGKPRHYVVFDNGVFGQIIISYPDSGKCFRTYDHHVLYSCKKVKSDVALYQY